jgi:hypothetical protein
VRYACTLPGMNGSHAAETNRAKRLRRNHDPVVPGRPPLPGR